MLAARAENASAHRPGEHKAGTLLAPKLHWLISARQTTNGIAASKCRPRPKRGTTPAQNVPEFARGFTIEVELTRQATYRLLSSWCPPPNWLSAVRWAQGPFPDTSGWLLSCSQTGSEGGWGRWVPNTQGSGAGGWLQFMASTFYAWVDEALAAARARGYRIPSGTRSWFSPLGQALTGAYMYLRGQRGQWEGFGC